jgi:c(7)-type cytochrome triheme protein
MVRVREHLPLLIALAAAYPAVTIAADLLGDITMDRHSTKNGVPGVVFPHWKHRSRFRCYACHPDVFEMQAGANDVRMDALLEGEFCGRCHNGKLAFAIGFDTCRSCHSLAEP